MGLYRDLSYLSRGLRRLNLASPDYVNIKFWASLLPSHQADLDIKTGLSVFANMAQYLSLIIYVILMYIITLQSMIVLLSPMDWPTLAKSLMQSPHNYVNTWEMHICHRQIVLE